MTEEQTANKERPVSFGGLSKTRYPVHNETSWKLLREASNHKIQGASTPENIWKLCKAAKQTLEHWCAWLQSSMEAVHTQTERYGLGMVFMQILSWVLLLPAAWEHSLQSLLFTMQTSKRSSPRPPASPCAYFSAALASSSQASHTQDVSRRTYGRPLLTLCALEAVLLGLFSKCLPLIFTIARMFCLKTKLCTTQEVNASSITYMAIFRNRIKKIC